MEEAFLKVIRETPRDEVVRKVYADWLDEHDRPEEADFFRKWTLAEYDGAVGFLTNLAKEEGSWTDDSDVYRETTFDEIIQWGRESLQTYREAVINGERWPAWGAVVFTQYGSSGLRDAMFDEGGKNFWKAWCLVTGVYMTPAELGAEINPFSCSC